MYSFGFRGGKDNGSREAGKLWQMSKYVYKLKSKFKIQKYKYINCCVLSACSQLYIAETVSYL